MCAPCWLPLGPTDPFSNPEREPKGSVGYVDELWEWAILNKGRPPGVLCRCAGAREVSVSERVNQFTCRPHYALRIYLVERDAPRLEDLGQETAQGVPTPNEFFGEARTPGKYQTSARILLAATRSRLPGSYPMAAMRRGDAAPLPTSVGLFGGLMRRTPCAPRSPRCVCPIEPRSHPSLRETPNASACS